MKQSVIYFDGSTQFSNTGDLLINKILLDLISKHGKLLIEDRNLPDIYKIQLLEKIDNIELLSFLTKKSFKKNLLFNLLKNFFNKNIDIYLLETPGHMFSHKDKPTLSDYKALAINFLFFLFRCRIIRIGVSLGPYSASMAKFISLKLSLNYFLGVRDNASLLLGKKYLLKNISYVPDLAWSYDTDKFVSSHSNELNIPNKKYIVLSFRNSITGQNIDEIYFNDLINGIDKLMSQNSQYHYLLVYQVEYDKEACYEIFNTFKNKFSIQLIDKCLNISEAVSVYCNAHIVISNRLHVLLLAIKANSLPLVFTDIEKHSKIVNIFQDEDLDECITDFKCIDINNIINRKEIINIKMNKIIKENTFLINSSLEKIFK